MIGNIRCGAPTVADDTTFMSDSKTDLQIMLNMAVDNSKREVFLIQPTKIVVMEAQPSKTKTTSMLKITFGPLTGKKCLL